jgi:F0F1-type ATP synthase assembly protein I
MADEPEIKQSENLSEDDKLKSENEALKEQLDRLKNPQTQSGGNSDGKLSIISDFINSLLVGFVNSHSALTKNFGGGVRGAIIGAIFLVIFFIGLSAIGYLTYETIYSTEQKVYIPENSD